MNWADKKVLILGLSKTGIAAAKYLKKAEARVFITELRDKNEKDIPLIRELEQLGINIEMGGHSQEFIQDAYLAVASPGIPPHSEIFQKLKKQGINIISEIELAYKESGTPFIAVTGTNGKTTTTALISHILSKKYEAPSCGNIGNPPCAIIDKKADYYVCEVSSYQLETTHSFKPKIACWLNFTPDHLDWHGGLENYFNAKAKLFKENPVFSVFNGNDKRLVEFSKTCKGEIFFFDKEFYDNCCYIKNNEIYFKKNKKEEFIIDLKDCPLIGHHNYQNIMCAIIVAKLIELDNEEIVEAIKSFKALEHRMEFVREYNGIKIYNDSKATNPESSIKAIGAFENQNVVLITGGRDKNTDLSEFCDEIKEKIKNVILIGEASERFAQNLQEKGFSNIILEGNIEKAVDKALELKPRVILFSPACSSFDMFKNYEHRGEIFKEYVLSKK